MDQGPPPAIVERADDWVARAEALYRELEASPVAKIVHQSKYDLTRMMTKCFNVHELQQPEPK